MKLIDSHCHIHESEFFVENREEVYQNALSASVAMVCASTSVQASREALAFAVSHDACYPLVGVHPHDSATEEIDAIGDLLKAADKKEHPIYGIGEIGLDYYYMNSPRDVQIRAFEQQLQWAIDYKLPVSFHIREEKTPENGSVWDDFWAILDNFHGIRGVLHSFTDSQAQLDKGFSRGLFVGVNGISTFTKDVAQQELYKNIPLERMLIETDAPFLTPAPFRGKMNEPSFVGRVAEHMATVRGVSPDLVSATTTANARALFSI